MKPTLTIGPALVGALIILTPLQAQTPQAFIAANVTGGVPTCANIPTLQQVKLGQAQYVDRYYSAKQAASLGIPLVNVSGNRDYLVIVRDYRRWKDCLATDGKTKLEYGHVVRTVLEVLSLSGSADIQITAVAAKGTLENVNQYFYLYKDGINNPEIEKIIATVSGKVFNVENYALYQEIMPKVIELFGSTPDNDLAVNLIGIVRPADDSNFLLAPARAYSFAKIAKGWACSKAAQRFANDASKLAAVEATYKMITGAASCSNQAPSSQQRDRAKGILDGIKVK